MKREAKKAPIRAVTTEKPAAKTTDLAVVQPKTPSDVLTYLLSRNDTDLARVQHAMDLAKEYEALQAKKEFAVAFAEFKKNKPIISKSKHVKYATKNRDGTKGKDVDYWHAELDTITDAVDGPLSELGLSYSFDIVMKPDGKFAVGCTLEHVRGHSRRAESFPAPYDESGGKNAIQAGSSTNTYLQRVSLLAVLGMSTKGADNDGRTMPDGSDEETDAQRAIREERERKEAAVIQTWKDAIEGAGDLLALKRIQSELVSAYVKASKVPEEIKDVYRLREKELS